MSLECRHIVPSELISVVIQGPTIRVSPDGDLTAQVVASVRRYFPAAEIILSTWERAECSELDVDVIIKSQDPGYFLDIDGVSVNFARQVVSTRAGLSVASRPYALKLRTDHRLLGTSIAVTCEYSSGVPVSRRLLRSPITISNLLLRNPVRSSLLFCFSDLVQFGRLEDLRDLWSQDLLTKEQFCLQKISPFYFFDAGYTSLRQIPDQAITTNWLSRHGLNPNLSGITRINYHLLYLWEQTLVDNFIVLDWRRSDIDFPERFLFPMYLRMNYTDDEIANIRTSIEGNFYFIRYLHLLLTKNILRWLTILHLTVVARSLLYLIAPKLTRRTISILLSWHRALKSTMKKIRVKKINA